MRLVLDTNVVVSAVLSEGAPRRLLTRCIARESILLESPTTLQELAEVLQRPKFHLAEEEVERVLAAVASVAELIEPTSKLAVIHDDPDDDRFLELAIDGRADLIVTGDRHLLDIKAFRGIPILKPVDAE